MHAPRGQRRVKYLLLSCVGPVCPVPGAGAGVRGVPCGVFFTVYVCFLQYYIFIKMIEFINMYMWLMKPLHTSDKSAVVRRRFLYLGLLKISGC